MNPLLDAPSLFLSSSFLLDLNSSFRAMIHNHFYYYVVVFTIPHVIIIQCGVLDVVVLLPSFLPQIFLINVPKQ